MSMVARLTLLVLLSALASCSRAAPAVGEPKVDLNGRQVAVDLALSAQEHRQGLQGRTSLDPNKGMLFVFDRPAPRAFWMRETLIPLDILFFDEQHRFINGHFQAPPCVQDPCPIYPSQGPAMYVLEMKGGEAQKMKLKPGDPLRLQTKP